VHGLGGAGRVEGQVYGADDMVRWLVKGLEPADPARLGRAHWASAAYVKNLFKVSGLGRGCAVETGRAAGRQADEQGGHAEVGRVPGYYPEKLERYFEPAHASY